jgi:hypothetical protein
MTDWLDDVQKMDSATLTSLMQMGSKVQKLLEIKDRMKQVFTGKPHIETAPVSAAERPAPDSPTQGGDHGKL